jgi:hypothetical protein
MVYYDAAVLKKIESCFFAIINREETADSWLEIPQKACFA